MGKVLTFANQKGGTAKTTSAVTLAAGLARAGHDVLLVDLDAQGNVADTLGMVKDASLYRFIIGRAGLAAVRASGRDRLDVVVSNKETAQLRQVLAGMDFREYQLKEALAEVTKEYDAIVLDVAPGADVLQISALVASDYFLIPVSLAHLAVVGVIDVLATVASLKRISAFRGELLGILPTFWDRTTNESAEQLRMMTEKFGRLVWPPIPVDVKAREAPRYGKTLWEYAPDCRALAGVEIRTRRVGGYDEVLTRLRKEMGL